MCRRNQTPGENLFAALAALGRRRITSLSRGIAYLNRGGRTLDFGLRTLDFLAPSDTNNQPRLVVRCFDHGSRLLQFAPQHRRLIKNSYLHILALGIG